MSIIKGRGYELHPNAMPTAAQELSVITEHRRALAGQSFTATPARLIGQFDDSLWEELCFITENPGGTDFFTDGSLETIPPYFHSLSGLLQGMVQLERTIFPTPTPVTLGVRVITQSQDYMRDDDECDPNLSRLMHMDVVANTAQMVEAKWFICRGPQTVVTIEGIDILANPQMRPWFTPETFNGGKTRDGYNDLVRHIDAAIELEKRFSFPPDSIVRASGPHARPSVVGGRSDDYRTTLAVATHRF